MGKIDICDIYRIYQSIWMDNFSQMEHLLANEWLSHVYKHIELTIDAPIYIFIHLYLYLYIYMHIESVKQYSMHYGCNAKEHCRGIRPMIQAQMPVVGPAKPDHLSVKADEAK